MLKIDRNAFLFAGLSCSARVFTIALAGLFSSIPVQAVFAQDHPAARAEKDGKPRPAGPFFAVVSIAEQRISVYGGEGLVVQAPVSTGMRGHPTPTGIFSIVQKKRWHESNIYSGAPMPFMQRITWSGVALHAGALPGYPASHGCIRLPSGFAQRLFGMTRMGQRVIIAPKDVTPIAISHPNLPAPYLQASGESGEARAAEPALENVKLTAASAETKKLNPLEFARDMKTSATEKARLAARATKAAQVLGVKKGNELRVSQRRLAVAENLLDSAKDRLAAATRKLEKADDADFVKTAEARAAVLDPFAEAKTRAEAARVERLTKVRELLAAKLSLRQARADGKAAGAMLAEANRRLQPLSVFVSKKTGRLYVRQDFEPIFDTPVAIRDADRMIGTHVFMGARADENGTGLNWVAISMPQEAEGKASDERARISSNDPQIPVTAAMPAPSTALDALDRIAVPEEAARRLAELSWVGASFIVSDHGISGETGETTDFIILTRTRASAR